MLHLGTTEKEQRCQKILGIFALTLCFFVCKVEILRISSFFMLFFYRRLLSLWLGHLRGKTTPSCFLTPSGRFATSDVCIYASRLHSTIFALNQAIPKRRLALRIQQFLFVFSSEKLILLNS